jgi:hypothetical protein
MTMSATVSEPLAIVRPAADLATLFAEANSEHEAGQRAERATLEHYRRAGTALLKAKAAAGHGNWLKVLGAQCKIPQQRASEYMRLAERWDKLPPGGNFALKEALRLIAGEGDEDDLADLAEQSGELHDKVPEAVGVSGKTHEKAEAVVEATEADPDLADAVAEMDRTGKVDPAYQKVKSEQPEPEPKPDKQGEGDLRRYISDYTRTIKEWCDTLDRSCRGSWAIFAHDHPRSLKCFNDACGDLLGIAFEKVEKTSE